MAYNTKQREAILSYFRAHPEKHVTAADVIAYLEGAGNRVGVATVYRTIDALCESGVLRKFLIDESSSACYQLADGERCHAHFHLKCNVCGKLFHIEDAYLASLADKLAAEHDFELDSSKTVFYGSCRSCQESR